MDPQQAQAFMRVEEACRMQLRDLQPEPPRKSAVTVLELESEPVMPHKSMTTSRIGCEQQTRTLPSAGLSSGSGPYATAPETKPLSQL
jgi:hypothetical protein